MDRLEMAMWIWLWEEANPDFDPDDKAEMKKREKAWAKKTRQTDMSCAEAERILSKIREEFEEQTDTLGTYAMIRRDYLFYYDKEQYWRMMGDTDRFQEYLEKIQQQSRDRVEELTEQIAKREDAEALKQDPNPLSYVGEMNNIEARAREIVIAELSQ